VPTTYKNLIGADWKPAGSGATFTSVSPANHDEVIGEFAASGPADVDAAVAAARRAFPSWSAMPAPKRGEVLFRIARLLAEHKEELSKLMTREMGKVLPEARGDVQEAIDVAYYMAGEGRRLFGQTVPSEMPDKFAMSIRRPIGVVGIITPWNFPVAIPAWKLFPALICGNTAIIKPASDTPACLVRFVELLVEGGLPDGVVNVVTGSGGEVGNPIVEHPDVRAISFTGHTDTGVEISTRAAKTLKRVSLELGGKSAAIILDDADLASTVEGLKFASLMNNGQACVAQTRILASRRRYDEVVDAMGTMVGGLEVGDPTDPATDVGPLVAKRQQERVEKYIALGQEEGAKVVVGGNGMPDGVSKGWYVQPTVFAGVDNRMRLAQEEIFGPVLAVIPYDDVADAVRIANDSDYGLAGSVWTADAEQGLEVARRVRTGTYGVNRYGMDFIAPFGGFKASGLGREFGREGLEHYLELKSILP
jgi:aldehyde dehydrogenase (NAD+)